MSRMEQREQLEAQAKDLGHMLSGILPPGVGFFLSLFEFGEGGGWSTYMSNGQRADMVKYLRELAARLEGE